MKIAFDLRRINNPGIGRYMKCLTETVLAQAPEHEYLLILPPGGTEIAGSNSINVECMTTRLPYYSLREQLELPRILRRHGIDVLHSPHFNVPLQRVCPMVVTIHDVIYLACPGDLPSPLGRLYYRTMMKAAVRRAHRVLTVSEWSRQDIIRYFDCDPNKVEVVYSAVRPELAPVRDESEIRRVLSRFRIDDEYILYTGIYKPRKNHAALLHAFRHFLESGARTKLVIAGPLGDGEARLRQLAAQLGIADHLVFPGFVSDDDLPALYTAARVYACPSLYEGFGFTVLEAMACGVPVVCSAETSLPEVAGTAALYADPRNVYEFAVALKRAFVELALREELMERGFANVRRFSWAAAASRALATYEQAAGISLEKEVRA
jgi:glycosyltransferase involved in cell wall biosynthesis